MFAILFFLLPFSLFGINWSAPTVLSTPMVNASNPMVVSASNGNVVAAWIESGAVKAKTGPAGGTWGAPATLVHSGASSLRLAIDGSGNATALWVENGTVVYGVAVLGYNGDKGPSATITWP